MNNAYPKTFTHRDNHHASVVVMNAEQEAQLPDEFRAVLVAGAVGTASSTSGAAEALMLSPEYGQLMADREKLEQDRLAFAEYEANTRRDLEAAAEVLRADRAKLVAGYTADKYKLDADRARLDDELAQWEATKAGSAPQDTSSAPPDDSAPADATGPSKRTRIAKE